MSAFTIDLGSGATAPSAIAGLTACRFTQRSRALDEGQLEFIPAAAPSLSVGDKIAIASTNIAWAGRVRRIEMTADGLRTRKTFHLAGAWFDLGRRAAVQNWWKAGQNDGDPFGNQLISRYWLGSADGETVATSGDIIAGLITYAASHGADVGAGTISLEGILPIWEESDITVAEALDAVLRHHPGATMWFVDAGTTQDFYARPAGELTTVSIALDSANLKAWAHALRPDLTATAVIVNIERLRADTALGKNVEYIQRQVYPASPTPVAGDEGVIVGTLDYTGLGPGAASSPPAGIAQSMYEDLSSTYGEGFVTLQYSPLDFDPPAFMGGQIALGSLGGVCPVQEVAWDLLAGTVTARFGPLPTRSVKDWAEFLTYMRGKRYVRRTYPVDPTEAGNGGVFVDPVNPGGGVPEGYSEIDLQMLGPSSIQTITILAKEST